MSKAVFFDRDGIVNRELGDYIKQFHEFEIHEPVLPFLAELKSRNYLTIIITNQGGIAKGLYDHALVDACTEYLQNYLRPLNLGFDAVYYCPHHPQFGACLCRKPSGLLIEKAIARFKLDPHKCFMVGDKERDVLAAEAAGIKGYLLPPNPSTEALLQCLSY
ncbi:MAG: D-glycero-alpha-D-manno-heptose-1,7-bisphosphate 7-phosphatase [Bacteroidia bacterium]|jgi:D-glycero-D-manno-heptose 1,7-bisphosphate phosphatase